MAQINLFEKQRRYSGRDFSCSVGKNNRIHLTFRNESWKKFTASDRITITIDSKGDFVFGDPEKTADKVPTYKLTKNEKGNPEIYETTRYTQITGDRFPAILSAALRARGDHDFPTEETEKEAPQITEELKGKMADMLEKLKESEERLQASADAPELAPVKKKAAPDAFEIRRQHFYTDANYFVKPNTPPELAAAIFQALASLYSFGGEGGKA